MGLCCSKANKHKYHHKQHCIKYPSLVHPTQPIYCPNVKLMYPQRFNRPPPYNPASYLM